MFTYQKTNRYFAQIARGLEAPGAEELAELGASEVKPAYRGIYFSADKGTLYRINYHHVYAPGYWPRCFNLTATQQNTSTKQQ